MKRINKARLFEEIARHTNGIQEFFCKIEELKEKGHIKEGKNKSWWYNPKQIVILD